MDKTGLVFERTKEEVLKVLAGSMMCWCKNAWTPDKMTPYASTGLAGEPGTRADVRCPTCGNLHSIFVPHANPIDWVTADPTTETVEV